MEFNLTNFVGILICFTFFQSFSQQIYELDASPKCLYNVVVARVFLSILDHVWLLGVSKRNALMYIFGKAKPKNPGFTRLWPPLSLVSEKVQELQEGPIRSLKKIMFFFLDIFLLKKAQESPQKINHYLTWSYWSQQRCWEIWQEMSQKFNIPSEKWWLEDYFLSGMAYFQASC